LLRRPLSRSLSVAGTGENASAGAGGALMNTPQINLFDPALQQCPYAAYRQLRDEAPVYNIPGTQILSSPVMTTCARC
jgi:hypothetical protein